MSLLVTSCHGYSVTGVSGWPATPTKVWVFGWFKVDATTAGVHRAIAQISAPTLDGTQDYLGLEIDGSNVIKANERTGNINNSTPDPGDFYLWNGAQQNKWTVGCAVLDLSASAADLACIFGRAAATAKAATTLTLAANLAAFGGAMSTIYVGADRRKVASNAGTTNDATDGIKLAYIAIGTGAVPSQANIQACIDGTHPADLAGVWEYWDLTSSSAGLVGALRGITLAPFGGAATTAWDGADNPTVSAPTSPSSTGTIGATQAPNTSSIDASRSSDLVVTQAKNAGSMVGAVTITGTAAAAQSPNIAIIAGTNTTSASITTPPMKNNTGFVFAGETGVVANVYNPTTGALVLRKTGLTSDANGVVVISDPALAAGTLYAYEIVLAVNGRRLPVATAT